MGRKNKAGEKRSQITWALYNLLAKRGHEKVTIKEIAKEAGLAPGVIHYYFKNKDEIITNLSKEMARKYTLHLQSRVDAAITSEQKIKAAIDIIIDDFIFDFSLNRVFYNLVQMSFERKELKTVIQNLFQVYRDLISGVFRSVGVGDDSDQLGASVVAVSEGFAVQFMIDPKAFDTEVVRDIISKAIKDRLNIQKLMRDSQ